MHTEAQSDAVPAADPVLSTGGAGDGGALALIQDQAAQAREQVLMLFVGFGTGLTIGLVFLTYIVLEKAKVLP